MRVCLMIEGQEDVGWADWVALATACEDGGLEGLFRSDHYLSVMGRPPARPNWAPRSSRPSEREGRWSLDAWATISALAAVTRRIRLGSLVSPATFRHPSVLAKMAVTADHVSGGRIELGLGAGWLEGEHRAYGFEFPPTEVRMEVLAEQLEIVHRSWAGEEFSFEGRHYTIAGLNALPKPVQRPHLPLIVGGQAGRQSVQLAARWADEYNTVFASADECRRRRRRVEEAFEEAGRSSSEMTFSLMTGCIVGEDAREVERRAGLVMERSGQTGDVAAWITARAGQWVIGTVAQVIERLRELSAAGVNRVMLQHLLHRDLDAVRLLGTEVAPKVA